ncbi:hypothetical protein SDC9_205937 [bioreactor metagenome]|uniref:Uncharacterized protein n=1 Tax=bioreactor metagenome TaxID=1076179 RepID=A0A645JCU9_9ZZZZ
MRRSAFPESGSVNIILSGDERAQRFDLCFTKSCELTDFKNPIALQLFCSGLVLGIAQIQAVREPITGEL